MRETEGENTKLLRDIVKESETGRGNIQMGMVVTGEISEVSIFHRSPYKSYIIICLFVIFCMVFCRICFCHVSLLGIFV